MSELRINISRLPEGTYQYDLESDPSELELDERFEEKIKVHATLNKSGQEFVLRAEFSTDGSFVCDRCLEPYRDQVKANYSILYRVGHHEPGERKEDEGDTQVISPDTNVIDLGEDVRQYLLLALPVKFLCQEDCQGLCPSCGANRNRQKCSCDEEYEDPRWDTLKKLTEN